MKDKIKHVPALLIVVTLLVVPTLVFAEIVGGIAAVVNNDIITQAELNRSLSSGAQGPRRTGAQTHRGDVMKQEVLNRLIDEAIFNQILSKSKIEVSDDDMARAIANILHQNRMTLDQLKGEIASKGMTYDEYKRQIEREIRRVKFINQVIGPQVRISDQDLRDHYQQNQGRFHGGNKVHIAEIVMPLEGITSQEEFNHLGELTMSIVAKARHGTNFQSLVKQHSKGPNIVGGGDLGTVNLKDLPPQVADGIRGLRVGEVTNPIVTENAIVIVKLISLPDAASGDFDKARDDIYSALYDQKVEDALMNYLAKERQKAFVEIR